MISTITQNDLDLHAQWLKDNSKGQRLVSVVGEITVEADLSGADLSWADLSWADLSGANLSGANLSRANLSRANLSWANLSWANLSRANLSGADLSRADLSGANLSGANLSWADLREAKEVPPYVFAVTNILPAGNLIVYKKANCGTREVILTLEIPAAAKRSNATGRKCRAEYAILLCVDGIGWEYDGSPVTSKYDRAFVYPAIGETITPDGFDDDCWNECSTGVHFFITRYEAETY